ncbi:MAG: purine-nucleoside phosphorylase [Acidimicrobiales bacterium]
MEDAADRAAHSARELGRRLGIDHHDVLVLLGSGLSGTAEALGAGEDSVPLDTLPFFPAYTAGGHRAHAWSLEQNGLRLLILGGRCHLYEGLTPVEVVHPLRTGVAAGCRTVILTAAAGGIRDGLGPGSLLVVDDHLNLTGRSPLVGPDFVDLADAYAPRLRALALAAPEPAAAVLASRAGVYAQLGGPQFETPAEIRMLRAMGADVVGMSMALEAIAARRAGAEVLGLALVTNPAAAADATIDVADIASVGSAAVPAVAAVIRHVVGSLA